MTKGYQRVVQIFTITALLFLSATAVAGIDFCTSFPVNQQRPIVISNLLHKSKVINTLTNYSTTTEIRDGVEVPKYLFTSGGYSAYCLIFQFQTPLNDFPEKLALALTGDFDVYIIALDVTAANGNASFFEITNNNASRVIYLVNSKFHNVMTGVTALGSGRVEMYHVDVSGDAGKSGPCINLKSPAMLDDVEAKSCGVGVKVEASNATITSTGDVTANLDPETNISNNITNISQNKIGIHIISGVTGTKITRSRVFGNDDEVDDEGTADGDYVKKSDMIRMDDGAPARLVFYDGQGQNIAPVDEDMTMAIDYGNRPVYINVPLAGAVDVLGNVIIDFFSINPAEPGIPQIYSLVDTAIPIEMPTSQLMNAAITYHLPANSLNNHIVAVYNDPRYGTTAISQPFKTQNTDIVIFVSDPFDQTTQGNPIDGGAGTTGGTTETTPTSETPTTVSSDGGGGGGTTAMAAKLCTFIPDSAQRTVSWGNALWWLILLAPAAGLSALRVKSRKH